jgi:putative membrane-bound dehydrogenase-like protein
MRTNPWAHPEIRHILTVSRHLVPLGTPAMNRRLLAALAALLVGLPAAVAGPPKLSVLFLGDNAGHQPPARFRQLQPEMARRGIDLTYTDRVSDLNPATLAKYDGLMIFANHTDWSPENERALLDYVASGKGFIPLHCASYCFIRSQPYIDLVGAQFRSHTTGVFRTKTVAADHPIMKGFDSFESWDETYTHHKHNTKDRTVLEVRTDRGGVDEPWTWVRTHGKGRVFYTAWGHDHRTWSHPGFHALVERGTRWACGQSLDEVPGYTDRPKMTEFAKDAKPFEFQPATLPYYPPGERWGTTREPIKQMQKPLPAAESVKHYVTPVDFEIRPFVTEEKLGGGKPIAMTWDERGRLWLALTFDYPNEMRPRGEGRDRIVCCEDADGDGACDTVTVFADKLSIPTSLLPVRGGLVVHQAPDTLFLKDTDGDGKADVREVLFTGWGTRDTHAGPSNLRYGFDGWVYGMCGYSGFNGTVGGEPVRFGQGLYRFRLAATRSGAVEATKLEFLRSTNNNSWGVAFNEAGELFGSTANGCPLVHLAIPNRYYEKVRGLTPAALPNIAYDNHVEPVVKEYRQVDWHGGFTAGAGCAVYTARTYPPEYWNRAVFVSEPTAHLTAALILQPNGPTYTARYGWNLLAGRDDWAAPIDAQVGPDGNMWVIDWYNIVVQHNPTPQGFQTGKGAAYETPLRDKKYGRVYRVVYTKAKPEPRTTLADATPEKLVETLKHPNMTWRLHAQRLLVERGKADVVPAVAAATADPTAAPHAAWVLAGLPDAAAKAPDLLRHPSPAVRRAAVQTLPATAEAAGRIVDAGLLADPDAGVRVAALLAVADRPATDAVGPTLVKLLAGVDRSADPIVTDAVTVAATAQAGGVLKNLAAAGKWSRDGLTALERVAAGYARSAPAAVGELFAGLVAGGPAADAVVNGLSSGWVAGKSPALSEPQLAAFGKVLAAANPASRGRLLRLAGGWGMKGLDAQIGEIADGLLAAVADEKLSDAARLDAARQAIEFLPNSDVAVNKLLTAVNGKTSPALAVGIFEALGGSTAKGVGPAVVAKLKDLSPTVRPAALRVALARAESARAFLDAVEKGEQRFDALALDQKTALAAHPDKAVAERAKRLLAMGGGLPDADRQKVIEQLKPILAKTGDVGLGKKAFVQHCAKCHRHGGEGQTIGPDLTGFAVHPKEEILIHVMDPSRSVEGNYKAYTANTADGRVITGLLASETKTSVELLDAEGKRHALSRDDLESLKESPKSLMPEGFEKQMNPEELTNLLEFLTQKGKYVPVPLDRYATAVSTKGMFFEDAGEGERLEFPDWKPKEFKGVPFYLVDPQGDRQKNVILLNGPNGRKAPDMPKSVTVPCNTAAKAIHLLSGIGGWNYPATPQQAVSVTVRLHYEDGQTEDHPLRNGVHFADYIRRVDVPGSEFAFRMRGGQQVRYLKVEPKRAAAIKSVEFVKGPDQSAPVVVAVTVETP